jgi:hypothetical protein
LLIADELTMYMCVDTQTAAGVELTANTVGAGDFASYVPGDAYRYFIAGRETQHAAGYMGSSLSFLGRSNSLVPTPGAGHCFWLARPVSGTGDPIRAGLPSLHQPTSLAVPIGCSEHSLSRPTPGSALNFFHPAVIANEALFRGLLRGVYVPINNWSGTRIGLTIVNPPGLTGTLYNFRHNSHGSIYASNVDGHIFVDGTSEWPL